jgi:prepilin-type N-terminal cleavage/methylation domain-containing protein
MSDRKIEKQSGFSVIELLVAVVILGFVVMGIGTLFPKALSVSTQNRMLSRAFNVANGKIEQFYRMPATAAALAAGTHGPETIDNLACTWNVELNYPMTGMRKITVGVVWPSSASFDSIGVVTYIMK